MSITFKKVSHIYHANTPLAYKAIDNIDLHIQEGIITAIIGETGSGKSTLIQHLNALLLPSEGSISICGKDIHSQEKPKQLKELRKKVGLVFQFPEYQLFEETILKDVSFGPKNFKDTQEQAEEKAKKMLNIVGLDASYYNISPLDISGGQKRRVAIAGILAMNPDVLVLDEPTAGLDPQGAKDMMKLFKELNTVHKKTVLIVTHDMDHVLDYCDHVVVVKDGHIVKDCDVLTFFDDVEGLTELGIRPPAVIQLKEELKRKGFYLDKQITSLHEIVNVVAKEVKKG